LAVWHTGKSPVGQRTGRFVKNNLPRRVLKKEEETGFIG